MLSRFLDIGNDLEAILNDDFYTSSDIIKDVEILEKDAPDILTENKLDLTTPPLTNIMSEVVNEKKSRTEELQDYADLLKDVFELDNDNTTDTNFFKEAFNKANE